MELSPIKYNHYFVYPLSLSHRYICWDMKCVKDHHSNGLDIYCIKMNRGGGQLGFFLGKLFSVDVRHARSSLVAISPSQSTTINDPLLLFYLSTYILRGIVSNHLSKITPRLGSRTLQTDVHLCIMGTAMHLGHDPILQGGIYSSNFLLRN